MSDKVVSIFDKFSLTRGGDKSDSSSDVALEAYHAATTERPGKRAWSIRICYSDGVVEQIGYSYRRYDLSLSPDWLGISFTTGAVILTGKNLRLLLDDLQDERIRSLQPFDPARHKIPKEGEIIISTIEWKPTHELKKYSNLPTEAQ